MNATAARISARTGLRATEAAFAGLSVLRAQPRAFLVWAGLVLAFGLVFGVATVAIAGSRLMALQALGPLASPQARFAAFGALAPFYLAMIVVTLAFYSVAYAAVNRALIRPATGGPGFLALGADEFRQGLCLVLVMLVLLGVYLVGLVVVGLIGGVATAALGRLGGLIFLLLALGLVALLVWLAVRLSLASPLTFDGGRVRVLGSFALTRGRFWSLLGAYVLSALLVAALYLALIIVLGAFAFSVGGGEGAFLRLFSPNTTSLAAYYSPTAVIQLLLTAAIAPVQLFTFIGAPAGAYAQLRGTDPAEVF